MLRSNCFKYLDSVCVYYCSTYDKAVRVWTERPHSSTEQRLQTADDEGDLGPIFAAGGTRMGGNVTKRARRSASGASAGVTAEGATRKDGRTSAKGTYARSAGARASARTNASGANARSAARRRTPRWLPAWRSSWGQSMLLVQTRDLSHGPCDRTNTVFQRRGGDKRRVVVKEASEVQTRSYLV